MENRTRTRGSHCWGYRSVIWSGPWARAVCLGKMAKMEKEEEGIAEEEAVGAVIREDVSIKMGEVVKAPLGVAVEGSTLGLDMGGGLWILGASVHRKTNCLSVKNGQQNRVSHGC